MQEIQLVESVYDNGYFEKVLAIALDEVKKKPSLQVSQNSSAWKRALFEEHEISNTKIQGVREVRKNMNVCDLLSFPLVA